MYEALLTSSTAILYADGQQVTAHGVYHLLSVGPIFYVLQQEYFSVGDDLNTNRTATGVDPAAAASSELFRGIFTRKDL